MIISIIIVSFTTKSAFSTHYFMINQSEDPIQTTHTVCLNKARDQKLSSFYWAQNLNILFSEDKALKAPQKPSYKVIINLEDFSSGSLNNIANFLVSLATTKTIDAPVLVLENGTSYKFNKIFPGIQKFFQETPKAQVIYTQGGLQTPKAAREGLSSLSSLKEFSFREMDKLTKQMKRLTINSLSMLEDGTNIFSFSEWDSESDLEDQKGAVPKKYTTEPVVFLRTAVQYKELEQEIEELKLKWDTLGRKEWPPLGVKKLNQVRSICGVSALCELFDDSSKPIILEVEGLFEGEARKLADLCHQKPSIQCVVVQNSACNPKDFKGFHITNDNFEKKTSDLLGEDKIRFVNVQTAFKMERDSITNLCDYFERKHQKDSLNYFVELSPSPSDDSAFQKLTPDAQKTHQLFWVLSDYLELLRSSLSQIGRAHV